MSTEEELKQLKETVEKNRQVLLRKSRTQNMVLGLAAIVAILFMIYGFTQKIEAGRQRDLADEQRLRAESELSACKRDAMQQRAIAESALKEAQLARTEAERQFEELAKSKAKK